MKNKIEMAKLEGNEKENQLKAKMHDDHMKLDIEKLKQDQLKLIVQVQDNKENHMTQRVKAETERFSKQVDLALKKKDMHHRHFREAIETHSNVHQASRDSEGARKQ